MGVNEGHYARFVSQFFLKSEEVKHVSVLTALETAQLNPLLQRCFRVFSRIWDVQVVFSSVQILFPLLFVPTAKSIYNLEQFH